MKPNSNLVTISNNKELISNLLNELVLTPRLKALEWAQITKQTPNMKIGYPGQHLASLVVGMEGARTGARGHDIIDGSEVKSCSRVDQLDTCKDCAEKVMRIESCCSSCGSKNIDRKDDSKWLFTIRNENDLKVLTQDVDRIILILADYPNFEDNNFEDIRFQVFEIWTKSPRHRNFVTLMTNYYHKIYLTHKEKDSSKTPAPKNFWPYDYQFYLCNPIKVFSCIVKNANTKPETKIDFYLEPTFNRADVESEKMPTDLLKNEELKMISELPDEILKSMFNADTELIEFKELFKAKKLDKNKTKALLPYITEEIINFLPLRDTDKISESKSLYERK